jgi:hypothetical protein
MGLEMNAKILACWEKSCHENGKTARKIQHGHWPECHSRKISSMSEKEGEA